MNFMPSCQDITKHSSDYLDRSLPRWRRLGIWFHMMMCVNCRRYVSQLQLTIATIRKHPKSNPPPVSNEQVDDVVTHMRQHIKPDD